MGRARIAAVVTLPSSATHEVNEGLGEWSEESRWALVEDLRLGALEGEVLGRTGARGDCLEY